MIQSRGTAVRTADKNRVFRSRVVRPAAALAGGLCPAACTRGCAAVSATRFVAARGSVSRHSLPRLPQRSGSRRGPQPERSRSRQRRDSCRSSGRRSCTSSAPARCRRRAGRKPDRVEQRNDDDVARGVARRRRGAPARSRPRRPPSSQPRRVRQRDSRSVRARRQHEGVAAARRSRRRLRQRRGEPALSPAHLERYLGGGARHQPPGGRRSHARRRAGVRDSTACRDCSSRTCASATTCRSARAAASRSATPFRSTASTSSKCASAARSTTTSSGWATRSSSICASTACASNASSVGGEAKGTPGPLTWNGEIVGETPWELYMHAADAGLELRTPMQGRRHASVSVSFVDSPWEPEGVTQPLQVDFGRGSDEQYDGYAAVDALTIHGPYQANTATAAAKSASAVRLRAERRCRRTAAARRRSCRRSPAAPIAVRSRAASSQTLLEFYDTGRAARRFDAGIQSALERMLVSFNFLFRVESNPPDAAPGTVHRLSDLDLASRLSFFLWSSIPDDELLTAAVRGQLRNAAVLEQQVRRMLRDPRSRALVDNFGTQWLGLRKADSWLPDPNIFPEFDENLRDGVPPGDVALPRAASSGRPQHRRSAARGLFVPQRAARRSTTACRASTASASGKVTFTDDDARRPARPGRHPDGDVVPGPHDAGAARVLGARKPAGHAAPAAAARRPRPRAHERRTGGALSIREQMEVHRKNPACAVCHVRMDPLGFSLENFDAIGRWRTHAARACRSMRRRCSPTGRRSTASQGLRTVPARPARELRRHVRRASC